MLLDYEKFRPIKNIGIALILFCILAAFVFSQLLFDPNFDQFFKVFIIASLSFYLITAIGIIWQKIWGYYLLKIFLYLLVPGVPIGTYLGLKGLRYIKENEIKRFFKGPSIEI